MALSPLKKAYLSILPWSHTRKNVLRLCERSAGAGSASKNGVTVLPAAFCWEKPGTPAAMPFTPGNVPNRWSKDRFCMITTITFLMLTGVGLGVGLGLGVGV